MQKTGLVEQDPKQGLPAGRGNDYSFFSKPVLLGLFTFMGLSVLFGLLIYQRYLLLKKSNEKEAIEIINLAKDKLDETLSQSLSATKTISFFIDRNGQVSNFDSIAAQVLETTKGIDALQLVPDGIIRNVYPLAGNENVIGYNILKDTARNKEAFKAIDKKEMFFAGPFSLRQGGVGVVGRLPVYRNNRFWGFSAVVIKMSTLFKAAGIDSTGSNGYHFQLSKINPDTRKEEYFLPVQKVTSGAQVVSVDVPNGEWKLALAMPTDFRGSGDIKLLVFLGFLVSLLGGLFVYKVTIRPKRLNELVQDRTRELRTSENNYRSLIERVSDAFVSMDNDWNFTYVNKKAGELLGKEPGKLLGKNMWEIFHADIDKPYYHAYRHAMQSQQYQFYEEFYPSLNKWYENHMYPSKDGLTIFFKDVTQIKNVTEALSVNEEKYRSLIEQASDGIVITDLEGNILEVNNSIAVLCGYTIEEMQGKHLYDFIPRDEMKTNPLRFKELMEGKSLLYERKLLKRDGTLVDIEVNSKMASSQTLIGFIRDISERKKHEAALQYQASLLQNVSDAITSFDVNRNIVSWNRACEELYGFTAEEALGKRIPDLVTFKFPDTTTEEVFKQLFSIGSWKGEFNFKHPKTNETVFLLSNLNVLKNEHGVVNGFILTSKNLTSRIQAEELIRKSNERFELIAQSTNDAVWDHNFLLNETWGNNKLYDLYGIEPGKQKINFEMFLERLHPEDRPGIVKRMNSVIAVKGDFISEEFRFKTAGGYKFFYDRSYIKYDAEGKPLRILGAMQDITERENAKKAILESEEKFSRSFHSNLLGLALYDEGFHIVDANDVYIQILETTREELIGKHSDEAGLMSKVDPTKKAGIDAAVEDLLQKTGKLNNYEMEIEKRNGYMATILVSMEPLRLNEKDHWLTSAVDISNKKKAEKALQESEEKYRALVENAPEALVVFGVEKQQFVSVSESATRLFGMTKEELLKIGPIEVSPQYQPGGRLSSEMAREKIQLAIQGEKPVFEWTHCDKQGNPVSCEIWLVRLPSDNEMLIRGSIIDITERKKTEAEILKSKMQFQNLVENIPGVYWVTDLETYETLYISPSYETIWGLTCEGLYRNPADFINAVHPDDKPFLEEAHKNIAATKKASSSFRIIRPDGSIRWILANTNVITDDRGKMIEYGYAEDITQRKQAEEVLEESERFLKETQLIAKLGTYSLDITNGKWSSSEILNEIFGIDAAFDKTVENWESIVHPEWKKTMSDYLQDEVIGRKKKFNKEYKIIRKSDQTEHWVHGIGRITLNDSGEPILMVGTIQDISERKQAEKELFQSEQRYRLLFYNNPLPMWMTTFPGLDIIDVNEAAIKQYGYSREEFLKLNTRQLRPAEDVENFLKEVDKMQPDTINLRNWRHKKKDGTIIHVETYSHQIIYEGERVWLGLSHDVTEKYEARELLQKSYEDIRQLVSKLQSIREDERTGIAREIHDELGQQLTGLKMDLHWLSRKIKNPEKEISDKMKESIELINATITSVRKISTDLRPSILDDLGLLPALEWQGDEFEKRSGTTVEFINEAGDITVQPEAATAIFRIYQELLTNIARHANASLVMAVLFKDENSLYFSITDNGVGFDIEAKSNKKTLGLLGIKERTLLLGGTYEFKSKPGEGSVTTISIPLHLVKNTK